MSKNFLSIIIKAVKLTIYINYIQVIAWLVTCILVGLKYLLEQSFLLALRTDVAIRIRRTIAIVERIDTNTAKVIRTATKRRSPCS